MNRILHISDLHFGSPYLPRVGEALLRIAPLLESTLIVVSGDLTQRATAAEFAAAREFLDQLPSVPRVVVPGNHDVPLYRVVERFKDPHGLYRQHICESLDNVHRVPGATIVALDSTEPRHAVTNGRIREQQLDFCEEAFREAPPGNARIVVAHHHFAPSPDYERDSRMRNAKRAVRRFLELGVEMVMGGHLHRAYIGDSLDVYRIPHPTHRGIVIVQCGTTTSRRGRGRERDRNSFNLVEIDEQLYRITHYMYFDDCDRFEPISRHVFPRHGVRPDSSLWLEAR